MTRITFESATVGDAIQKAARIAPRKAGTSFDKAWGILMQVTPDEEVKCLVRATNTDVFYSEIVGCVEAEGDDAVWRLPSQLLASVLAGIPISSGRQVQFQSKGLNQVLVTSGRLSATVNLGDATYYEDWEMFDSDGMSTVSGLGGRLQLVEWAADTGAQPPMCGVWIDGEYLLATDRYKLVRVPMDIEVSKSIVVPAGFLGSSLRPMGDTLIRVGENRLQIMPDDYTQIETIMYDVNLPDVSLVTRVDYPLLVEVSKSQLSAMIGRAIQFAGSDRSSVLKMFFGRGEIAASVQNENIGLFGDVLEFPGSLGHARMRINFNPKYLSDAISKAPGEKVTLGYDPSNPKRFFYVRGDSGYECWIAPLADILPGQGA